MNKIYLFIFVLFTNSIFGQNKSFEGYVFSKNGNPLSEITIQIAGIELQTNNQGKFILKYKKHKDSVFVQIEDGNFLLFRKYYQISQSPVRIFLQPNHNSTKIVKRKENKSKRIQQTDIDTIAVLNFENVAPDSIYDRLAISIAGSSISEIRNKTSFETIERAQVEKLLEEQNFQWSGRVDISTAIGWGNLLGANYIIIGSYDIEPNQSSLKVWINVRMVNVETGKQLWAFSKMKIVQSRFELYEKIPQEILKHMQ